MIVLIRGHEGDEQHEQEEVVSHRHYAGGVYIK